MANVTTLTLVDLTNGSPDEAVSCRVKRTQQMSRGIEINDNSTHEALLAA